MCQDVICGDQGHQQVESLLKQGQMPLEEITSESRVRWTGMAGTLGTHALVQFAHV